MTYLRDACMGSAIEASFFGVVKLKSTTIQGNTHNNLFFWNSKFQVDTKSVPNIEIPSRMTFKIFFFTSIKVRKFVCFCFFCLLGPWIAPVMGRPLGI